MHAALTSSRRTLVLGLSAAATLFATGCTSIPNPGAAVRIDAYDPQGRSETGPNALGQRPADAPIIIAFEPGDELTTQLHINAPSLVSTNDNGTVRAVRAFELMLGPSGVYVREPGGEFERRHGSMSADLAVVAATQRNEASITIQLDDS
ncbi:MAG: hypothetical protein AB8G96_04950 [Phycisphaerales bacterium]